MPWLRWPGSTKRLLRKRIAHVASAHDPQDLDDFRQRARQLAGELGVSKLRTLRKLLHRPPKVSAEGPNAVELFCKSMETWQLAIFEIFYNFREPALPLLRAVAGGEYDWTQPKAVDVLSRFACEGLDTDRIVRDLVWQLPKWQYETQLSARFALARLAAVAPQMMRALEPLVRDWQRGGDPIDAFEMIAAIAEHAPAAARAYEPFLRNLLRGVGLEDRNAMLDEKVRMVRPGVVVALSGIQYPHVPHFHSIRAGILLRKLFPGDAEAQGKLVEWMETHSDEAVRLVLAWHLAEPESPPSEQGS